MRFVSVFLSLSLLLGSAIADTKTVVSFSRKINTCDPQDRPLTEGVSKVVWSYSDTLPSNENTIQRHDERGVQSVRFFAQPDVPVPPDTEYFDIKGDNVRITFNNPRHGPTTNYWCTAYKIELEGKKHVIRTAPIIDPRNIKQVHHILIYQCQGTLNETELAYSDGCFEANMPQKLGDCNGENVVGAWAVGGGPYDFPPNVGLPVGPDTTYLLMEIHYDNPTQVVIDDSSGFRFYYTDPDREYEGGVFAMGQMTDETFVIPPHSTNFVFSPFIPKECTQKMIPPGGIRLMGGSLHTHMTGVAANLTIIRNGQAFPPLLNEPYYDFNFQEFTPIDPEFLLLPGDELNLKCTYNTQYKDEPTYFGLSTSEEMCLVYLVYYPRVADGVIDAYYADWTGVTPENKTIYCDGTTIRNWNGSEEYIPSIPSVCNMSTPPTELTVPTLSNEPIDPRDYEKSIYLDTDQKYKLYWTIDRETLEFHGAVEVETGGWVGLGITEMGMQGADVFIAYARDGIANFADRFATQKALPGVDASQDYYHVSVGQYESSSDSGLSKQAIALIGGVAGGAIVLVVGLVVFCVRRKRKSAHQEYRDLLEDNETAATGPHSLPLK